MEQIAFTYKIQVIATTFIQNLKSLVIMDQIANIISKENVNLITNFLRINRNSLVISPRNNRIIIIFLKKPMKPKMKDFSKMVNN